MPTVFALWVIYDGNEHLGGLFSSQGIATEHGTSWVAEQESMNTKRPKPVAVSYRVSVPLIIDEPFY